jgi:hypothetical protein
MNLHRINPLHGVRRLQRIMTSLERIPELETKVEQVMVAYQKDARFAERLVAFQAKADSARVFTHVLEAARRAPVVADPCPHTVIENLVPDDVYDEIMSALPSPVFFKQENTREEIQVPLVFAPAYSRVVWDFFFSYAVERGLLPGLTDAFSGALDDLVARYWPSLGTWQESGLRLRVTNSRLLLRRPGYVIKPHRDPRWHFITCLIYLQKREGGDAYGTQLYRLRHEREPSHNSPFRFELDECELVRDVPARRNAMLAFFNSAGAHGASIPLDAPGTLERYVYQVQFGPDRATREKLVAMMGDADRPGWTTKNVGY